ncbi:MAG: hypothetical protein JRJ66_02175 [Deltaproteobacteria bacterium]|nr:hypothetical protein [Deltaproteobacteria bacterium]
MPLPAWIASALGGGAMKETLKAVGGAASNILDRFAPRKMSEAEKWEKVKDVLALETAQADIEVKDVNKAREMWMTFLRTQKVPWVARFMNAIYRPFCGFIAIGYLTDKFWGQVMMNLVPGFKWTYIERDPLVDSLVAVIIYFFFGYRQRSKEKAVANVN